ncbi:MAG: hypothetical protein NTU88_10260, partial [Armatimonadetes bacterium]|nr:hypothetical protein [Armatimonadota bacterium]
GAWQKALLLRQSADPLFDTSPDVPAADVGVYRDGSPKGDVGVVQNGVLYQRPRSIRRLEPPLLDDTGPAGGLGRYREVTRNSGEWKYSTVRSAWYNTGFYGWGAGIYVNNRDDIQSESELGTLRDDWMNPGGSQYWAGPYYTPPGVIVILTPYDLDDEDGDHNAMTGRPDMIIMQSNSAGAKFNWYDPDGNVLVPSGGQVIMPYPRNGVLFAEGNVRIKGTLPPHTQLTVVSGGTIYVEGNILKWRVSDTGKVLTDAQKDDAIALLAKSDARELAARYVVLRGVRGSSAVVQFCVRRGCHDEVRGQQRSHLRLREAYRRQGCESIIHEHDDQSGRHRRDQPGEPVVRALPIQLGHVVQHAADRGAADRPRVYVSALRS